MSEGRPRPIPRLIGWAAGYLEERGVINARLNAEILLSHVTGRDRVDLYARPEAGVTLREILLFRDLVRRRGFREPLQHILGRWGFRRLDLLVDSRALIPRPETELLVERALGILRSMRGKHPVVVDVGTGSGCIALSICREYPQSLVYATDISRKALELARVNAERTGMDGIVSFHHGDLLSPLPRRLMGRCDLVVSNPPYIKAEDYPLLPEEVRDHEPLVSLVAGPRGVEVHLRLMEQSLTWLAPGGFLLMEMGEDQGDALREAALRMGYEHVAFHDDLNGKPRVVEMSLSRASLPHSLVTPEL